jgi:hypothetical protein
MPTPDDLVDAPELAILAALDWTLDLVVRALVCAYPELTDPERPYWLRKTSRTVTAAETLVDQTADMEQAIIAYREAVEIQRQEQASRIPDDLPF